MNVMAGCQLSQGPFYAGHL